MLSFTPLHRFNWEHYLDLTLDETQVDFIPSVLFSIAQSKFEQLTPYGIDKDKAPVGFLMYGNLGGIVWISRILIDKSFQKQGIATEILQELIHNIRISSPHQEIRTSYSKQNLAAKNLFTHLGFEPINDSLDEEIVAIYKGK